MVKVFQYGSNMSIDRLEKRVGEVKDLGPKVLEGWRLVFDLLSKDYDVVSDIVKHSQERVIGRLYELTEEQLKVLAEHEKLYQHPPEQVRLRGGIEALTFIGKKEERERFWSNQRREMPAPKYIDHIIRGLEDRAMRQQVPLTYISNVLHEACLASHHIDACHDACAREVKEVYAKPKRHYRSTIGISKALRKQMGVKPGDIVMVVKGDKKLYLRVRKAPLELVIGPSRVKEAVCLGKEAREYLGLRHQRQRDAGSYKDVWDGMRIYRPVPRPE